jgi:hypothetical protein
MRYFTVIALGLLVLMISGCAPKNNIATKGDKFPKMYDQQPQSLLILPPMNESTDAEAKDYYMTTVEMPFALKGYYVLPVEIVSDIMKQEGVTSTELLYNMPPDKLYEYFGADAVLYTRIKKWDVSYAVVASSLTVSIESEIVSSKTSEKLWTYTGTVVVDLSGGNSGGGIVGLIAKVIIIAINTASADYVKYAHVANGKLIYTLPAGPYDEKHLKDQDDKFIDQAPKKENS